jgi:hypothetical protein
MDSWAIEFLNKMLMKLPDDRRDALAMYIAGSLDQLEAEMIWDREHISDELKAELDRRAEQAIRHPEDGIPWKDFRDQLLRK